MNPSSTPCPNYFHNPNNYPNPNFLFHSLPQPPLLPPQIHSTTAITTPILDLSTALSSLTTLLSLSDNTLNSLSSLVKPTNRNANFISCPYNPNHLMPPESLFLHSLRCPSLLFQDPSSIINSLHYPKTLNLKDPSTPHFTDTSNTELYLSLDGFYDEFGCNFFYKDCPGVVEFNDLCSASKAFTLLGVLSVECANVVARSDGVLKGFNRNDFRILPSDLVVIRREVDRWVDYPSIYSYAVFCAILRLNLVQGCDLKRWVIANSPRYGVVIDVHMRDHIYVLFRLCLNAIRREALGFVDHGVKMETLRFNCPLLVQVLMWIVSQLTVLYGEINAKHFSVHIFRQCILDVSNRVLFPLESNVKEISTDLNGNWNDVRDDKLQEPLEGSRECIIDTEMDESVEEEVIFVSQVAASVAALHERALLEAKIKGLRQFQPRPSYQRMNDHDFVSRRADEERKKRSNYRAIIDHDGLPRRQSSNQETSKIKTREEILAEERDYKRRRMSYRGKKLKRTTLQVMRDIIDEYMDEIKQAGGIGCFETGAGEEGKSLKSSFSPDFSVRDDELRASSCKSAEAMKATPSRCHKYSHFYDHNVISTTSKDASNRDYERQGKVHHGHRENVEYKRSNNQDRHGRDYSSGSSGRHRCQGSLYEQSSRRSEHDDVEFNIIKSREKRSSGKFSYHNHKSSSYADLENNPSIKMDDKKLDVKDRNTRNSYGIHSSKFRENNAFEDRYNPAESRETNENDGYTG